VIGDDRVGEAGVDFAFANETICFGDEACLRQGSGDELPIRKIV
jgi:hypothetical protein